MTNVIPFPRKRKLFPLKWSMWKDLVEAGWTVERALNGAIYCSHPDITDVLSIKEAWNMLYGGDAA